MSKAPELTFFYIVEPPDYQIYACTLLASIRRFFSADVKAIGYCPEHRMDELHPAVFKAHEMMDSEIRPMKTQGVWDSDYPHGNKIIASVQPRESAYSAFVDSDVLFLRDNRPENLIAEGHVSCSVAASMLWADQSIWNTIYGAFDMPIPAERLALMRQSTDPVIPYFSSGLVVFPESGGKHGRFADVWYQTARRLDKIETLDNRRPYLDQMSLPVAIRRAGLNWNLLPEEQHFIMGGKSRGKPLPEDRDIFTVHYRRTRNLRDAGLHKVAHDILTEQTGVKYVRRLTPDHPEDAAPLDEMTGLDE